MSDTDEIQTLHALNDAQAAEIARLTAELEKCREGLRHARELWMEENPAPEGGEDHVTPFDHFFFAAR